MIKVLSWISLGLFACAPVAIQGGSNANDRSAGGEQGEIVLTGAMIVSPDGNYIAAQRNQTSVVVNLKARLEPNFIKNLPGFGPVALDAGATRLIAYLDTQRMDPSMFDDPSQVPSLSGPRYYILVIDPTALSYTLAPIGDDLPRFALSRDGHTLLVDATVQQVRGDAKMQVSVDSSGNFTANVSLFGTRAHPWGYLTPRLPNISHCRAAPRALTDSFNWEMPIWYSRSRPPPTGSAEICSRSTLTRGQSRHWAKACGTLACLRIRRHWCSGSDFLQLRCRRSLGMIGIVASVLAFQWMARPIN